MIIFNVLSNLKSFILAACDGTTVLYRTEDTLSLLLYHVVLSVGARSLLVSVSPFGCLSPVPIES